MKRTKHLMEMSQTWWQLSIQAKPTPEWMRRNYSKQESIPVGCIPPTLKPYMYTCFSFSCRHRWSPPDVTSSGVGWDGYVQRVYPQTRLRNITYPQLLLRMVIILTIIEVCQRMVAFRNLTEDIQFELRNYSVFPKSSNKTSCKWLASWTTTINLVPPA